MDPRLAALRSGPVTNEPRFYPPGQNPATAKLRAELKLALGLRRDLRSSQPTVSTKAVEEYIEYLQNKLAEFEEGESEAKMYAYEMLYRKRR